MVEGGDFASVIAGARSGEEWAVTALFRDLQPRLLRYLRAQESRVADDLAAEVWLAVAQGIGGFSGDEKGFRAWVFTIARRRVIEHRRKGARRRTDVTPAATFSDMAAAAPLPDLQVIEALSGQEAAALIASLLNEDQAEVVLLRVLGDLDVDQVAEITGKTPNWVRVTQHRALRKLADRLGPRVDVMR
ncbi:MAG: RNA polymerase sigma factor [Acidimicrobiia bacterium]